MAAEIIINKVIITAEAKFDYEQTLALNAFPTTTIKKEAEEYIEYLQADGKLLNDYYFRAKYYDERSNEMLMLFFYKSKKIRLMQTWELIGICRADNWSEELEYEGQVKTWLNTKVDITLEPRNDWVLELREAQRREELGLNYFSLLGLPREVENAIYNGTDSEISEILSHLQRKGGEWVGYRRYCPELRTTRKVRKRTR